MSRVAAPGGDRCRVDFLAGLRVLELGDGVTGAATTSLLWALGADVTTAIDPSSAHRRGRPSVERDDGQVSLLSIILDRGKRLVTVGTRDDLAELLVRDDAESRRFDLVVVDRVGASRGFLASLHDVDSYADFVEKYTPGAWLTISAFGLTGERAEDTATELTVAAAGGMLSAVRDPRTGRPLKLAGSQSLLNAGQAGALAACHAVDMARHDGSTHLDLSAVEATIAMGPTLEVGGLLLNTGSPGGAKRYGAPASFYGCQDGLVRISAMEDHQWQGVVQAMGAPEWATRFDTVASRVESAPEIDELVAAWATTLSKFDAETLLQSHGVPASAMRSPVELLESPQLAHRGSFDSLPVGDGREAQVVGLPFRVVDGGNENGGGERRRRSLRGLRMLEASRVLAAPLAGAVLGALGAEVTKLEDLRRLDMYRRRGPYIDGEEGMERSAYFALVNHSKRSAAFDVDAGRGLLGALLESSDVVLENLGRKRAEALGLAASCILRDHPDLLGVSSSGFGQDGPHASYRAYAYNMQASCALGYLTRNEHGEPAEIDVAWADLVSGYALATIIAAWAVGPRGNRGTGLDFAMADITVSHFNDFVAAASLDADADQFVDRANELSPYAPHGVYPTANGWIALSIDDDDDFASLSRVLAHEVLADPGFATADARFEQRGILDERIAEATRGHTASELARTLRAAGVVAEEVVTAADLLTSSQLLSREFFTAFEHPEWGHRRVVGIPWRPFGGPPLPLAAPPLLAPCDGEER